MADYEGYDSKDTAPLDDDVVEKRVPIMQILREEVVMVKWRVLVFACFLTFGSYYIYDFPGAIGTGPHGTIERKFQEHGKAYSQEMNQALYSVYSWPNTVLAFFGGLLIDKFLGLRKAMLLFTFLVFLGSAIFYIGVLTVEYPVMILGRICFGLGGESLSVAQSAFVARWFKSGRGMALAFGITISFSRVGSSFNFLFSPMLATHIGINTAVMFGMLACVISFISCFALVAFDIYGQKKGLVPAETKETSEAFHPRQILALPGILWVICGITVFCYCAIFPFVGIAKNFFEVKYGYGGDEAARYVSFYMFACAGGSPVIGLLVDMVGRFVYWIMAASVGFVSVHVLFLATPAPPPVMMAFMGLLYSFLASSLWPSVPYAVNQDYAGTAFGLMTAMQNAGLATFPLIAGGILDKYLPPPFHNMSTVAPTLGPGMTDPPPTSAPPAPLPTLQGYKYTEVLFMASALTSTLLSILMLIMDKRGTGALTASPDQRKQLKEEQDALLKIVNTHENV